MEQQQLFFEDTNDALRHVIQACGGAKAIGAALFPHIEDPAMAGRRLMDCLNGERPEKLDLPQVIAILRIGHEYGCHVAMHYLCKATGYTQPEPVEREDERAALQRQFITSVTELRQLANRIATT